MMNTPSVEPEVRRVVQSFYDAFKLSWLRPLGGIHDRGLEPHQPAWRVGAWTGGRTQRTEGVHSTFRKGVTDSVEQMSMRACS